MKNLHFCGRVQKYIFCFHPLFSTIIFCRHIEKSFLWQSAEIYFLFSSFVFDRNFLSSHLLFLCSVNRQFPLYDG